MNLLVEQLPVAVEVNGKEYPIRSDFRTCLRTILAFEDDQLTGYEKQVVMLNNLYPEVPDDVAGAIAQAQRFLNGGAPTGDGEAAPASQRLYSFGHDANLIFAAFRQTHGIDLETADLHWWKFLALFMDLGSETTFCNLIALRKRLFTGKATREERMAAREMESMVYLPQPDTRTPEEKDAEAEFLRLVEEGRKHE